MRRGFARPGRGHVPAPEVTHATKATVELALEAREAGEERVVLFNLRGHFDLGRYEAYLAGKLVDHEYSEKEIERSVGRIAG